MSEEILINITSTESRVAMVDNGLLQEVWLERANHLRHVGNIYKGTVCRVLPGMQAAFVDIGLERTAFLHASDIYRPVVSSAGDTDEDMNSGPGAFANADVPPINSLILFLYWQRKTRLNWMGPTLCPKRNWTALFLKSP